MVYRSVVIINIQNWSGIILIILLLRILVLNDPNERDVVWCWWRRRRVCILCYCTYNTDTRTNVWCVTFALLWLTSFIFSTACMHKGDHHSLYTLWEDKCNHCACFDRTGYPLVRCTSYDCGPPKGIVSTHSSLNIQKFIHVEPSSFMRQSISCWFPWHFSNQYSLSSCTSSGILQRC